MTDRQPRVRSEAVRVVECGPFRLQRSTWSLPSCGSDIRLTYATTLTWRVGALVARIEDMLPDGAAHGSSGPMTTAEAAAQRTRVGCDSRHPRVTNIQQPPTVLPILGWEALVDSLETAKEMTFPLQW